MVTLFKEPIEILDKISSDKKSEMTEWQLSFLCGLIKENKPQKLVEIGVAAGGTTAVILNCIKLLELDTQVNSIDISEMLYSDQSLKTGYLAEQAVKVLDDIVNFKLYTGGISAEFLEEIGKEIDFLILDTMHVMPGELLDFLACLPFLKEGSIVVLHDILLHHLTYSDDAYATQLLLDTVVAEKIIDIDPSEKCGYPNIGAFKITKDTKKYIANVFNALLVTWQYVLSEKQVKLYRNFYSKYYGKKYSEIFDTAVQFNQATIEKKYQLLYQNKISEFCSVYQMIQQIKGFNIYIYGCGSFGQELKGILEGCGINICGFIVSDVIEREGISYNPYYLSEIDFNENEDVILVGVDKALEGEVQELLSYRGINHYILLGDIVCNFLRRWRMN